MTKKVQEPQYIMSALNTPMLNYKKYYMNVQEKIFTFLLAFVGGGIVGLAFYGGTIPGCGWDCDIGNVHQ